jgi:hypothetical protein
MAVLGSLIAIASVVAFTGLAALVWWGVARSLRSEIGAGFRVNPPTRANRALALAAVLIPAGGAALLALLAAARILLVALGGG